MPNAKDRVTTAAPEGWQGWDTYAPFYDWENQRTIGQADLPFWQQFAAARPGGVLELGCGTGRLSLPLARSGVELVGVDRSAAMIARARTRSRRAKLSGRLRLVRADIRFLPFPARSFRAVIAPYGILQSLLTDEDLRRVLASVARVLRPRGVFGIDLVSDLPRWPEYTNQRQLSGSKNPNVHLTLVESVSQERSGSVTVFTQRYTARGQRGATEHCFELRFRTPSVRRLTALLKQAGLSVASISGDYAGGAWHKDADTTIIVARRA
jgi:ubiquinone/menaquinone biosynthesis C-methylase UbiE